MSGEDEAMGNSVFLFKGLKIKKYYRFVSANAVCVIYIYDTRMVIFRRIETHITHDQNKSSNLSFPESDSNILRKQPLLFKKGFAIFGHSPFDAHVAKSACLFSEPFHPRVKVH